MSYSSLLTYVKEVVESLDANVLFVTGRKEVIHELREALPENQGILFWCLPFISSGSFTDIGQQFNETVVINCLIYKQDYMGSELTQDTPETTSDEIDVLYQTKEIADQFIRKFNFNELSVEAMEASEALEIQSITFDNVIKDNDYLLTGTLISINVNIPDDFDYCTIIT